MCHLDALKILEGDLPLPGDYAQIWKKITNNSGRNKIAHIFGIGAHPRELW